jgi:hypothetical protein
LTLPQSRLDAFELPIKKALSGCLLKELQGVAEIFDSVRETLQGAEEFLGENIGLGGRVTGTNCIPPAMHTLPLHLLF